MIIFQISTLQKKFFFEEGYTVSNLKDLTKKLINVNHENLNEEDPFFDGVRN